MIYIGQSIKYETVQHLFKTKEKNQQYMMKIVNKDLILGYVTCEEQTSVYIYQKRVHFVGCHR